MSFRIGKGLLYRKMLGFEGIVILFVCLFVCFMFFNIFLTKMLFLGFVSVMFLTSIKQIFKNSFISSILFYFMIFNIFLTKMMFLRIYHLEVFDKQKNQISNRSSRSSISKTYTERIHSCRKSYLMVDLVTQCHVPAPPLDGEDATTLI